jgi:DNA-binding MarR family transcriptional regulator
LVGDIAANFVVSIVELVKDRCRNYLGINLMAKVAVVLAGRDRVEICAPPRARRQETARDAWRTMVEAVMARREYMQGVAARCGLTLPQAHILRMLGMGLPQTTTSLARLFACDASNITGLVDRLEARSLITRRSMSGDRRVKIINITARGRTLVARLNQSMLEPPPCLVRLAPKALSRLAALLTEAFASGEPPALGGVRSLVERRRAVTGQGVPRSSKSA